jgi:MFS family permease
MRGTLQRRVGIVKRTLFLSFVAALGGILFGYDTAVISGTIAAVGERFELDALAKGWYVGCALVGSIAGVSVAGWLGDRFGRKPAMLFSAVLFTVSALGCMWCVGFADLVAYRIIGGVGIGIVSIVSPVYISEISPQKVRGMMVLLYQLAITAGFVLAYLVNYLLLVNVDVPELWRIMLGAEAVITILFLCVVFLIPESPRWIEAHTCGGVLRRRVPWRELKKPGIVKAMAVGCAIALLGQFMGVNAVLYYGPEIFANAGFAARDSSFSTVLVGLVNMFSTILAVFLIDRIGRKGLVYIGVSLMIVCLVLIGAMFEMHVKGLAFVSAFLVYIFAQAISISAVVFVLLSEMYPDRVRAVAMSVAGFALWIGTYLIGQFTPWCMAKLGSSGTFFFFAAMCVPYLMIIKFLVPDTTGKSLEEIESFWS